MSEGKFGVPLSYTITRSRREALRDRVRDKIVAQVPQDTYHEADDFVPFRHDTGLQTIVAAALPFTDGVSKRNAVYVLECLQTQNVSREVLEVASCRSVSDHSVASRKRRVLYVGVTKNLVKRLYQHLNQPGRAGAYFTAQYAPLRILAVGWFHSYDEAQVAERVAARMLQEKYPDDYVAQPG